MVHFVGEMAGSTPASISIEDLLARRPGLEDKLARRGIARQALASLTLRAQWEAWLAIGFDRDLLIVAPAHGAERSPAFAPTDRPIARIAGHSPAEIDGDQPTSRTAFYQHGQSRCAGG